MSKKKASFTSSELIKPDILYAPKMASVEQTGKVPKFTKAEPVGNLVLVERIFESELLQSTFHMAGEDKPSNQGIVLAIGPTVNPNLNLKVGDRVLLQGSFTPVPNDDKSVREQNLVLPDMIKAVLT